MEITELPENPASETPTDETEDEDVTMEKLDLKKLIFLYILFISFITITSGSLIIGVRPLTILLALFLYGLYVETNYYHNLRHNGLSKKDCFISIIGRYALSILMAIFLLLLLFYLIIAIWY